MTQIERTVYSLLNDDHGITEEAFINLTELIRESNDRSNPRINQMLRDVQSMWGRFFLPADFVFDE